MIEDMAHQHGLDVTAACDVAVVGAGPAGIVLALELARAGQHVILVESGLRRYEPCLSQLSEAAHFDPDRHAPVPMASRRQIGGSSVIWGGRCVPYDPVDFDARDITTSHRWPLSYDDVAAYFDRACRWAMCGRPVFSSHGVPTLHRPIVPGMIDGDVKASDLERWSLPTNFGAEYFRFLYQSHRLRLFSGLTCTSIEWAPEPAQVTSLRCRSLTGNQVRVLARHYVLAAGGLETTRLLLASRGPRGRSLGDMSGNLGRYYMAHVEGVIANVQFTTPPCATIYGYERDIDGTYVRRRFTFSRSFQLARQLPNLAFWIANPELADADHGNGALSFIYLTLTSPLGSYFAPDAQRLPLTGCHIPGTPYGVSRISPRSAHFSNIRAAPLSTLIFATSFGRQRFLTRGRRIPGFFVPSPSNTFPLQYHGEHLPNPSSRVTLASQRDPLGVPRVDIDLRFSDDDVAGAIRAHEELDRYLRRLSIGRLVYKENDREAAVEHRLGGGFHQIGTTRMSANPSHGVVDRNLTVHGVPNLHVASSSTFVTSSQANSTFLILALAIRLADHLRGLLS